MIKTRPAGERFLEKFVAVEADGGGHGDGPSGEIYVRGVTGNEQSRD